MRHEERCRRPLVAAFLMRQFFDLRQYGRRSPFLLRATTQPGVFLQRVADRRWHFENLRWVRYLRAERGVAPPLDHDLPVYGPGGGSFIYTTVERIIPHYRWTSARCATSSVDPARVSTLGT